MRWKVENEKGAALKVLGVNNVSKALKQVSYLQLVNPDIMIYLGIIRIILFNILNLPEI